MYYLLFILLVQTCVYCKPLKDEDDKTIIEEFIQDVMEFHNVPGLIAAIVKDGEPFIVDGYGLADVADEREMTSQNLLYIASCGKAFTATLLSKLLSQHSEYTLDTPVRQILGEEFDVYDGYRRHHINVRDLMSHRLGIPTAEVQHMLGAITDRRDLLYRARFFNPIEEFRAQLTYNNIWFTMAGRVAEVVSGDDSTFEELMHKHIFEPLGMNNTRYFTELTEEELIEKAATPYYTEYVGDELRKVFWDAYGGVYAGSPSGGIMTNAEDLVKWVAMQTKEGVNADGEVVLEEDAYWETITPATKAYNSDYSRLKPNVPVSHISSETYGIGWFLGNYRGYPVHHHQGAFWGVWSDAIIVPSMDIGIFLSANGPNGRGAGPAMRKIQMFALDILLGKEPWLNATSPFADFSTNILEPWEQAFETQKYLAETEIGHEELVKAVDETKKISALQSEIDSHHEGTRIKRQATERAKYAGTYGSYCCGNATITYNEVLDTLSYEYGVGKGNLVSVADENDRFLMVFREPMWFIPPVETLQFYSSDGGETFDQLVVPFFLPQDPPVFVRNLDMEQQPKLPEDCLQ